MPGGIIQIASYGSQDIFLTGNPQITFFKVVYRRHTNFSIETIEEQFTGIINFGEKIYCPLSKTGDLCHRMYLKIDLPEVNLPRVLDNTVITNARIQLNNAKQTYDNLNVYANYIFDAYNLVYKELQPINADPDQINAELNYYFTAQIDTIGYQTAKSQVSTIVVANSDIQTQINNIVANTGLNTTQKLQQINTIINQISLYLNNVNKSYYTTYLQQLQIYNDAVNPNANFAWIKRLGHFIYNYIDVEIGGTRIDRHYSDWINIWYELTGNYFMDDVYNKMIGDVPKLTSYNRDTKPSYSMYVPLKFWFNRHNGLALPLVAMRFSDVRINVDLRKIEECVYTDYDNSNNDLMDLITLDNITLYTEYIFLDQDERRKFAQSIHEYLIEQTQIEKNINLVNKNITCQLNYVRPVKELYWITRKTSNITPYDLSNNNNYNISNYGIDLIPIDIGTAQNGSLNSITLKSTSSNIDNYYKNNYIKIVNGRGNGQITKIISYNGSSKIAIVGGWSIYPDYTSVYNIYTSNPIQNPIQTANLFLNGETRCNEQNIDYYNYVQGYECHTNTPSVGVNVLSFGLHPEMVQPSGSLNMGRIDDIKLQINMTDEFINNLNGATYDVSIYANNYNILRVMGGYAGMTFSM